MKGIIVVDKPAGITSFKVVDIVKKRFKVKVGHAGTLDPLATGVLVLAVGAATKQVKYLINQDKKYEGTLLLGQETDSQDITGKILREYPGDIIVSQKEIEKVLERFRGNIKQIPPMVSAIQYKGKRLYKLARQGKVVERKPRDIEIFDLKLTGVSGREVSFYIFCSKGTYIRTIASDIGIALGYGAVLSSLRRTASGNFDIRQAIPLAAIEDMTEAAFEALLQEGRSGENS